MTPFYVLAMSLAAAVCLANFLEFLQAVLDREEPLWPLLKECMPLLNTVAILLMLIFAVQEATALRDRAVRSNLQAHCKWHPWETVCMESRRAK